MLIYHIIYVLVCFLHIIYVLVCLYFQGLLKMKLKQVYLDSFVNMFIVLDAKKIKSLFFRQRGIFQMSAY